MAVFERCLFEEKNNWESLSYLVNGKEILARMIEQVKIAWPDGTLTWENCKSREKSVSYSDHGHTYYATSDHLYVNVLLHGKALSLPVGDFNVVGVKTKK